MGILFASIWVWRRRKGGLLLNLRTPQRDRDRNRDWVGDSQKRGFWGLGGGWGLGCGDLV